MLLIDGVKYELWTPPNEDDFEQVVKEHAQDIFGYSIYLDRKQKLKSLSGIGSIPDGYVITLGNKPEVQIIELELASHTLQHIVSQIVNIINGIENPATQRKICNAIEDGINQYDIFAAMVAEAIKPTSIHRFLADSFSNAVPKINIIIDKGSPALEEAINKIAHLHRIIEFQTFAREGVGLSVHAHLFEPLYRFVAPTQTKKPGLSLEASANEIEIEVRPAYRKYNYIGIKKRYRHLFPDFGAIVELITNDGDVFEAKVGSSNGSTELWSLPERQSLREWYDKNPDLKEGDIIMITPIKLMKKYLLEIWR